MNKHLLSRISPLVIAAFVVGAIAFLFLGAYGLTRVASRGEVMGRVEVAGTDLGGMNEDQALTTLVAVEEFYVNRPAIFTVEGKFVSLDPHEAGFDVDEQAIFDDAIAVGRGGNPVSEFVWWLTHIFSTVEVELQGSIDDESTEAVFDRWDKEVIASPADAGGLELAEDGLEPVYPRTGTGINREPATTQVRSTLLAVEPVETEIPTHTIRPVLTRGDVDAALEEATIMLSGPVVMTYNGSEAEVAVEQLTTAFRSDTIVEGAPRIVNYFDAEVVDEMLTPLREQFEAEPVNAEFRVSGESISIIPGQNGTRIDAVETADRLAIASLTTSRRGELPIVSM